LKIEVPNILSSCLLILYKLGGLAAGMAKEISLIQHKPVLDPSNPTLMEQRLVFSPQSKKIFGFLWNIPSGMMDSLELEYDLREAEE
jgi:hypothetical protein